MVNFIYFGYLVEFEDDDIFSIGNIVLISPSEELAKSMAERYVKFPVKSIKKIGNYNFNSLQEAKECAKQLNLI